MFTHSLVGPSHKLLLCFVTNHGQSLQSIELPDDPQIGNDPAINDIDSPNPYNLAVKTLSDQLDGVVTVLDAVNSVLAFSDVSFLPYDCLGLHIINDFEQEDAVFKVLDEIYTVTVLKTH